MKSIFLTGFSGFVGSYILKTFSTSYSFTLFDKISINPNKDQIFLHLAGKAHDIKKISNVTSYYEVNTELTKQIFDEFLTSNAEVFIFLSTVKAVADNLTTKLNEEQNPEPISHYGISKLLAEQYILNKQIPLEKRVYILRPCMIHGPGNKGNLNLLYNIVSKGLPWPLGSFENKRSFCSIDNLCFIIKELIENNQIPSGIYNIADDEALSTNELIKLISESQEKKTFIWNTPKLVVKLFSKVGDFLRLPLNTERLNKLTETYIVSNKKIKRAINKSLPVTSRDGLIKTFNSFNSNVQ